MIDQNITENMDNTSLYDTTHHDTEEHTPEHAEHENEQYADYNIINGTEGDDILYGGHGKNVLNGGEGNDVLYGGDDDDILDGGKGDDLLNGGLGNNIYLFGKGDGKDTISATDDNEKKFNILQFKSDIVADNVIAHQDNTHLLLAFKNSTDQILIDDFFNDDISYNPIQQILFDDGSSWDIAEIKAQCKKNKDYYNVITGNGDDAQIIGTEHNDIIYGSEGDDFIYGDNGHDILYGGEGNDELYGEGGDDILEGGKGNDFLDGGTGNNTYIFGQGDGQDTISATDYDKNKRNILQFKQGIIASDVIVERDDTNLFITFQNSTDSIKILRFFHNDVAYNPVQQIRFDDGSSWDIDYITTLCQTDDDSDSPTETEDDQGNKIIHGSDSDDVLLGGDGDDKLYGQAGDDTLDGRKGNDYLNGGTGNNTYLFGKGDGQDTIEAYDENKQKFNILQFKDGVSPDEVSVQRDNDNVILTIKELADTVTIVNFFNNNADYNPIQEIRFTGDTIWNIDDIVAHCGQNPDSDQTIYGDDDDNTLYGGNGNDKLYGGDGNDWLYGEAGNDELYGGNGNDNLFGGEGDDLLDGGAGNDYLNGGTGNNTYLFGKGDGQDIISAVDSNSEKLNTLQFKNGISPRDIITRRDNENLILSIKNCDDKITVENFFHNDASYNPIQQIKFADNTLWKIADIVIRSQKGTDGDDTLYGTNGNDTLDGGDGNDILYGGDGDDILYGGKGNDILYGGNGNDKLYGGAGNDILDGGKGDDYLNGGTGDNIYKFAKGDGKDTISAIDINRNKLNILEFKEGINQSDIAFHREGYHLKIKFANSDDQITVEYFFHNNPANNPIQQIRFADKSSWNITDITMLSRETNKYNVMRGTNRLDKLHGTTQHDIIYGLDGNDWLYGKDGDDILDGGKGRDHLDGGTGNNTYIFGRGYGSDVITAVDSNNKKLNILQFKSDIKANDIRVSKVGLNVNFHVLNSTDKISVKYFLHKDQSKNPIQQIRFADGTSWLHQDIVNFVQHKIPLPMEKNPLQARLSASLLKQVADQFMATGDNADNDGINNIPLLLSTARESTAWSK